MNKSGFTLIEMIAVIIILGLISLITIPTIDTLIKKSEDNLYDDQVKMIEIAAKKWGLDNISKLPEQSGKCYISVGSDLVGSGYLEGTVIDPRDNTEMNGYVLIELGDFNQYEYNYVKEKDASIQKCEKN